MIAMESPATRPELISLTATLLDVLSSSRKKNFSQFNLHFFAGLKSHGYIARPDDKQCTTSANDNTPLPIGYTVFSNTTDHWLLV